MKYTLHKHPYQEHFLILHSDEAATFKSIMTSRESYDTLESAKMNFSIDKGHVGILSVNIITYLRYSKEATIKLIKNRK